MHRCLELAAKGKGNVSPNPLVGSVIVHQGVIIGEGYHEAYGQNHAEVNAIESVRDKNLLQESTLFVNLEPCSHHGKTPPCADLIIRSKIPKVVIANTDPHKKVAGQGIKKLEDAGIEVTSGVLSEEGAHLNRYFFSFHQKKRPYIVLKWAETADGFIGRNSETRSETRQISGKMSQLWLHQQRAEIDAILVGVNTVFEDDPVLTTRLVPGKNPLRFVIDPNNRMPMDCRMITDEFPVIILSKVNEKNSNYEKVDCSDRGIHETLLDQLIKHNCLSLMVEGGARTLEGFIEKNLWDEAYILKSHKIWVNGIPAPHLVMEPEAVSHMQDTELIQYSNPA